MTQADVDTFIATRLIAVRELESLSKQLYNARKKNERILADGLQYRVNDLYDLCKSLRLVIENQEPIKGLEHFA